MASSWLSQLDPKVLTSSALVVTTSAALYSLYRLRSRRQQEEEENVYESRRSLCEYLVFHYGAPTDVCSWGFGPKSALDFPKRCADLCMKHATAVHGRTSRALDIGCAVGRSTFELTQQFDEVVGVDFSHSFINVCNQLKVAGHMPYDVITVGDLTRKLEATIDPSVDRTKTHFEQGDACNLSPSLGRFDCVLAANLICRLHTPALFFHSMAAMVNPGGLLVITSPYTFLREFTPADRWVGGREEAGREVTGFDGLKRLLAATFDLVAQEDLPFLIRETERKHQWTVAHATVWRRKV